MAHSIQKKVKFSKGQIAPELVERTDLDTYNSSAQEITNLTSTVYGGLRTRRGTRYMSDIYSATQTGTVTNNIGGTTADIQNLDNQYKSGNISTTRDLMVVDYGSMVLSSRFAVKNIKIDPLIFINTSSNTSFVVPENISNLYVDCVASRGRNGKSSGGKGGRVQCDMEATEGQTLYIKVGAIPTTDSAEYNASDIRTNNDGLLNTASLQSRLIVAGGGGNGSDADRNYFYPGGDGGGLVGQTAISARNAAGGGGGTQTDGGSSYTSSGTKGQYGTFGLGGNGTAASAGGAGWYGGGGGSTNGHDAKYWHSGGGGGSSYTKASVCSNVVHTQGYNNGTGYVKVGINGVKINIQTSLDNVTYTTVGSYNIGTVPEDISLTLEDFRYVKLVLDLSGTLDLTGSLYFDYLRLNTTSTSKEKMIPYKFNNEQEYIIVLSDQRIEVFEDGALVQEITATVLNESYIPDIKYTSKDDTIILTHKDMVPQQLQRTNAGWVLSAFPYTNIPNYAFTGETSTTKSVSITPSAVEGAIKITASSSVFDSGYVGQFIDGNGGRVRITEYISDKVVNGVTVIPFYTIDAITSWKYISGYEAVWSATRGYPRTCLFAQQRLWFGGSRDLPSHIWASRVNDYNNFKNAGNYDNDAIDITLLTNNPILNMIEQRGIHIFTAGEEWTISESSITPNDISVKCNTQNGSLSLEPVVINGVIMYIEKNGKSLLGYIYDYEQASFVSYNMSIMSNLIDSPVRMSVEANSNTDRGDFLFMVQPDGTMLTACVAISENIFSISKFVTNGKIKDVCSLTSDTYIIVERGGLLYLEKLTFDRTDFTKTFYVNGDIINNMSEYNGYSVYLSYADKVEVYTVYDGNVYLKSPYTGYITAGIGFAYKLVSNPIDINNKTITCKKRISKATVYCKDTERLEFNGQKKKAKDTFNFYACTSYKDDVRFTINGEYYPVNILSVTLDLNYEG